MEQRQTMNGMEQTTTTTTTRTEESQTFEAYIDKTSAEWRHLAAVRAHLLFVTCGDLSMPGESETEKKEE